MRDWHVTIYIMNTGSQFMINESLVSMVRDGISWDIFYHCRSQCIHIHIMAGIQSPGNGRYFDVFALQLLSMHLRHHQWSLVSMVVVLSLFSLAWVWSPSSWPFLFLVLISVHRHHPHCSQVSSLALEVLSITRPEPCITAPSRSDTLSERLSRE